MRLHHAGLIFFLCLFISFGAVSAQSAEDDEADCLPPNFLIGSQVRVVGSVEAGGLPIRAEDHLDSPVIGFIPLESTLVPGYASCTEGRNWFQVKDIPVGDTTLSGYVVGDDGINHWLEASNLCTCSNEWLTLPDYSQQITEVYPDENSVILQVGDYNDDNPLNDLYYRLDTNTGALTPAEYPYAEIVTRDLTDKLGITENVFGENSRSAYSLYVSPDKQHILYFLPARTVDECAHFCYWVEGFVADPDGSNARSIGEIPTEASIVNVTWGTDGRLYILHLTEVSPLFFTVGFCIVDGCTIEGSVSDIAAAYGVEGVSDGSLVTTSPNGRYLAITPLYRTEDGSADSVIIDMKDGTVIRLLDNGQPGVAIFWRTNTQILYAVSKIGVIDPVPYGTSLMDSDLFLIDLDFDSATFRLNQSLLVPSTLTGEVEQAWDSWLNTWVNVGLKLFLAQGGLRFVHGGVG